ncbi:TPA: BRCT domain-containing protein [Vibrio cholerae]
MQNLLTKPVQSLSTTQLAELCVYLNYEYRKGSPVVSDESFDFYARELFAQAPDHAFFSLPQPTDTAADNAKGRIEHPTSMLSTDKAYELSEIKTYVDRCHSVASSIGMKPEEVKFRVLAKLDGIAGRLVASRRQLVTRGDGTFGNDISQLLDNGLVIVGDASRDGVGEVVMPTTYFDENLSDDFAHPRNFVSGAASATTYSDAALKALKDGAIHLVLYRDMPVIVVSGDELLANLDELVRRTKDSSPYPLDGTIIEVESDELKAEMGSNNRFHNWQIAKKEAGETADVEIIGETLSVGKTGRITHVFTIPPTELSGAVITKISGKNAKYVKDHGLGIGAKFRLIRSGLVIPNHLTTLEPVTPNIPANCPCCGEPTEWLKNPMTGINTFIACKNISCPAQQGRAIEHHFKMLGIDNFGSATIQRLIDNAFTCFEQIYLMNEESFINIGFGSGQAANFVSEIQRGMREPIQDKFLVASLGISKLGRSASEKILKHFRIEELGSLTESDLSAIHGFGEKNSKHISESLAARRDSLNFLLSRGFNIKHTQDIEKELSETSSNGSLSGVNIVFTGTMSGSRDEMQADAKVKGANVQKSVNKKTNVLCCGDKVGQKKLDQAKELGVEIISETEYWERYKN